MKAMFILPLLGGLAATTAFSWFLKLLNRSKKKVNGDYSRSKQ